MQTPEETLEQDRLAVLNAARPTCEMMFSPPPEHQDPMSLRDGSIAVLPRTNPRIYCGGLDGGIDER